MLLLTVVALLPLVAALVTITVFGRRLRMESFAHAIQSTAVAGAQTLRVSLVKDVEKLRLALHEDEHVSRMLADKTAALPVERRRELDALWRRGAEDEDEQKILDGVENNPIAQRLKHIRRADPRIAEILVTDRFGQLVAATGRTSDFDQSDEDWWKGTRFRGEGRILVPPITFDQSTGVWSVDVCIPISWQGEFVGVAKAVYDLSRWLAGVPRKVGDLRVSAVLVDRRGGILYRDDPRRRGRAALTPGQARMGDWRGAIAEGRQAGWRLTDDGQVQAFAPMKFEAEIGGVAASLPRWSLVLSLPSSELMAVVRRLSYTVLGIGLAIIAAIFLAGLLLVERTVIRRVRRLAHATRHVAAGDLGHRIEADWRRGRLLGPDEVDELAEDFNHMVRRVADSHRQLEEANELKTNFIRIAGHELRTPVSYLLGMTHLLADCRDLERLTKGLASMGAKARRLDEMIEAMFKLMPRQMEAGTLQYEDVSVPELLEGVYTDCRPFAERRRQRLIFQTAREVGGVRADKDKLRDVLENLVMNAIKFTPDEGEIRVSARHQLGGRLAVSVRDQGPGIDEADLPHIFEPFYSTADVLKHSSGTAGYQKRGMGLGLAIVKRFVELHKGTVHVASDADGTVFTISIPAEPVAEEA